MFICTLNEITRTSLIIPGAAPEILRCDDTSGCRPVYAPASAGPIVSFWGTTRSLTSEPDAAYTLVLRRKLTRSMEYWAQVGKRTCHD